MEIVILITVKGIQQHGIYVLGVRARGIQNQQFVM